MIEVSHEMGGVLTKYPGLTKETLPSGAVRYRVRRIGAPNERVLLTAKFGSRKFDEQYSAARTGQESACSKVPFNVKPWGIGLERVLRKHFKNSLKKASSRASRKEIEFNLNVDDLIKMFHDQDRCCAVSKMDFSYDDFGSKMALSPSIDRIDNTKGYTIDNVQIVTTIVNTSRSDYPIELFLEMCCAVAKNSALDIDDP